MAVKLPSNPGGNDYEDLIAAILLTLGYFTETRVVLRAGKKEVLELDVVATPLGHGAEARELVEAKKASWQFSTIFKLFGQRLHLNIPTARLVSLKHPDPLYKEIYEQEASKMAVHLSVLALDGTTAAEDMAMPRNDIEMDLRSRITPGVWFQRIARRLAQADFLKYCNSDPTDALLTRAKEYHWAVQSTFFKQTALARAENLYDAYTNWPKLSGDFVARIAFGEGVDETKIWDRLWDTDSLLWLQYLVAVEHAARLAILKNALDDIQERGDQPIKTYPIKFGSETVGEWPLHMLPQRFLDGLDLIRAHPHGLKLPYLFQVYLEVFGGFLFQHDQQELDFISKMTQIPPNDIVPSIRVQDHFFAPEGKTFFFEAKGEMLCMKMVPAFLHGTGAFVRQKVYGVDDYEARFPTMGWLVKRWHQALYRILEPKFGDAH